MAALSLQKTPATLPVNFDGIPQSMKDSPAWVLWRREQRDGGKWTKPPLQADGRYAKTTDPDTWATIEEAQAGYDNGSFDGVGVVLRDGLVGIDLDHVLTESGDIEPWADEIADRFAGTYIEFSPSGDGLHILARGTLPKCRRKAGPDNRLECYDETSPRYFTVTGHAISDECGITEQQEALDWLAEKYLVDSTGKPTGANVVQLAQTGVVTDDDILARAARTANGERFSKLFDQGDHSDYPSHSEADLALANMLAYLTQDSEQIDRLFERSALFRAEKWNQQHSGTGETYGQVTVAKALSSDSAKAGAEANDALLLTRDRSSIVLRRGEFVRAADLMAETTSTEWLIDGVLEQNTACTLFGASGSGKSFVAMDWACSVATGNDWHGREVDPGAVFYIVGEGQNGFKRRLNAWELKNETSLAKAPLYALTSPVPLSDGDSAKHLSEQIAKLASASEPPRMIIIDTLARNFGSGDENSNTDVNRLIAKLDEHLRIRFNASVVIVHHSGNSEKDRARGASALRAAMDHEYRVDTRGDHRVLTCTKMKDGPEDLEFHFRIESVPLNGDETAGALVPVDVPSKKQTGTQLRPGSKIALGALRTITDIYGVAPDGELEQAVGMFPPALVVHKDKWKESAIEAGISKGTPDSQRKAFDRAVEQLIAEHLVGTHGEYYWVMG